MVGSKAGRINKMYMQMKYLHKTCNARKSCEQATLMQDVVLCMHDYSFPFIIKEYAMHPLNPQQH